MYRLSPIILLLGLTINLFAQNPHGVDFKTDCATCHTPAGWEISSDFWKNNSPSKQIISSTTGLKLPYKSKGFDHNTTEFVLEEQHAFVDCRACHETLVFSNARTECISCHTDMHQQTVGDDCARCHNPENWFVDDITQLHYDNGFPLLGAHTMASCFECHESASELAFYRIGNECINCHLSDYSATNNPNHTSAGFSTNCIECHNINGLDWSTENINHGFFPLNKGHEIENCAECHTSGDYSNTPTDCFSCHQTDYAGSMDPNHQNQNFPTECIECHTTDPGWMPAKYLLHDNYFPIYSGEHNGEWDQCLDCHTNPSNYAEVSCTTCHTNPETDNEHIGVGGYSYNSHSCLACHPSGNAEDNFNHNLTNFPLTGVHNITECIDCHAAGYAGTPTDCASCHTTDFNQTINPNHNAIGISTDCASCHTTEPEWNPAAFVNHNDHYALNGAHAAIATDCATCHNGEYNNTPNTCVGCHLDEYNNTSNPNHTTSQFSTDCASCHTENTWEAAAFDHNLTNFPLTGEHITTECIKCHTDSYAGTPTDCASCHTTDFNQTINPNHNALGISSDCASCHTTEPEWNPATFANHNDYYVLNGAHAVISTDCAICHNGNYNNIPNTCVGCHQDDYNNTSNPNHTTSQFSTDCASCHTENAWEPATFDHNQTNFPLTGEHISTECIKCHTDSYAGTPTDCASCHTVDFNQTINPNHNNLGISNDCASCHTTEPEWNPASFTNHNSYYALNGAHAAIATDCAICHNGDYNNTPNTCAGCHLDDYNGTSNPNHNTLQFSTDCATCHSENAWVPSTFDHDGQYFPIYSGKHDGEWNQCVDCHTVPSNYSIFTCINCHEHSDRNQVDDDHSEVAGYAYNGTSCFTCHPTGDN